MSDLYKTLLISRPQVLSSGGSGLLVAANNLSDVADAATARTNLGVSSTTALAGNDSWRKKEGFLFSDSNTSSRGQIQTLTARSNLAGAPIASWVGWVDVPSGNPSGAPAGIAYLASSATSPYPANWSMAIQISTTGALEIYAFSNNGFTDRRQFIYAAFRSVYSGQRIWLDVRFTNGSATDPVVNVNGGNISSSFVLTATGTTIPNWLDSNLIATFGLTGFAWPAGVAPLGCWLNAHLTNTESDNWRITGRAPSWVALGGNRVANYTSNFSAGADGWTEAAGGQSVLTGNVDGIAGVDDVLRVSRGTTGIIQIGNNSAGLSGDGTAYNYEIIFDYYLDASSGITSIYNGGYVVPNSNSITPVEGAWQTGVRLTNNLNTAGRYISANGALAVGKNLYLKNVVVRRIGALSLPSVQSIGVVDDITAIGGNQARLVGMTPVVLDSVPISTVERPAEAYTTTSIRLLGGDIIGARKRRILAVTGNSSASVNLSLGTSSGGTQLISAQAVNGDFDISTFASRILAANSSLWLTFSGSTTASIHIHLTDI